MAFEVLVIDDEPWSRQLVISLIEWNRLDLQLAGEAEDASQAMLMIESLNPAIALTDMRMPGMDGDEFLRELEVRFPEVKIIVLSGYDDFNYLQQALRSGAVDYLLKPVDRDQLNTTLEKCTGELKSRLLQEQTLVFSNSARLNEYIEYRNRIFSHLLELDRQSVNDGLFLLKKSLFPDNLSSADKESLDRIFHDFIVMLEEFTSRFGLDSRSLESLRPEKIQRGQEDVFTLIGNLYGKAIDLIEDYQSRKGSLDLSEVRDHIDRYYREQITLESVSRLFLVTKEHMSRSFKKSFGVTLNDYITALRMDHAKILIVDEGLEIKQVAFLCGYTDLAYFYRVFKKHFGSPPGKMRGSQ
ncbi:response regulator transcription factor [Spirochaeta isovalerica]|uniref:Two-component system response regulator YesN n=1 Tax=Spirochaeta isovalerica TaxID=150 RepID=A0A841RGI7_9SPIO|nr:response regulator [Spirochaeta isovalerica]MBB6482130.1 two-component system response regulator YesN [Spirochaeta isovalerica]